MATMLGDGFDFTALLNQGAAQLKTYAPKLLDSYTQQRIAKTYAKAGVAPAPLQVQPTAQTQAATNQSGSMVNMNYGSLLKPLSIAGVVGVASVFLMKTIKGKSRGKNAG